jgi:hypothetical protein
MRRIILVAGVVVGSLVGADVAQACQACVSSHSCGNSTTRGQCAVVCNGNFCICGDDVCKPPQFLSLGSSVYNGPGKALRVARGTYLVANCTGSFFGMSYSPKKARQLKPALDRIALLDARGRKGKRAEMNVAVFQSRSYVYNAALE